jgi:Tfp pilus assembly protein PilN
MSRWWMYGSGVGIEIEQRALQGELRCAVVRVRPKGAETVATRVIENFTGRPAAEWGAEFAAFLKEHGLSHAAAYAVLPRHEVTVRLVALPALKGTDLEAAVRYQVDGLHPYPDEDVAFSFARLGDSPQVLVAMARHEVVERYATLFAEAGVALAGFTVSAAALYSGRRIAVAGPYEALLAMAETDGLIEVYGESEAKPVYSATFPDVAVGRARTLAQAELRLPDDTPVTPMYELAPSAALLSAVPRGALPVNLLPDAQRRDHSKLWLAPTLALLAVLAVLGGLLAYQWPWENQRLLTELEGEIKRLEPRAAELAKVEQQLEAARARVRSLDALRVRTREDLDALLELTRILPPPAWAQGVYLSEAVVTLNGEAQQSESLLKVIDESPRFKNSEFVTSVGRGAAGEIFQIRTQRETPAAPGAPPANQPANPPAAPAAKPGVALGGPPR